MVNSMLQSTLKVAATFAVIALAMGHRPLLAHHGTGVAYLYSLAATHFAQDARLDLPC